jgi:DNA-nicking Smr family endonuclease
VKPPRGLTAAERAAWAHLAKTVTPLGALAALNSPPRRGGVGGGGSKPAASHTPTLPPPQGGGGSGLDSHWDRRLKTGALEPDFTLDLHGLTLDQAHGRLERGLAQARSLGARLVLVVTGKPRPTEAADRGQKRGAIRAKLLDWLAAGPHGDSVAAIRQAHRRHGGDGALYLVLRKER